MALVSELAAATLCFDDGSIVVVDPKAPLPVVNGADSVMHPWLHQPWELQLPAGVHGGAEPGGAIISALPNVAGSPAGISSSSASSSSCSMLTFDGHCCEERCAGWMYMDDDSTDQLIITSYDDSALLAPRHSAGSSAASNVFAIEGGGNAGAGAMPPPPSTNKKRRSLAHVPRQHDGAVEDDDTKATKKHCGGKTTKAAKRAMEPIATPPPRKSPTTAAKNRRERINERLKVLQELVPNGRKVDTVTMLDKAITYVKFMQLQLKVLQTDAFWPTQGGKAPEMSQVKEALQAILLSASSSSRCA